MSRQRAIVSGFVLLASTAVLSTSPPSARAQTPPAAAAPNARSLLQEGQRLVLDNKLAEARPKLEEAARVLDKDPLAHLWLGECYERLGLWASARESFARAVPLAERTSMTKEADEARKRVKALEAKQSTLTVGVPAAAKATSGLDIARDGVRVTECEWGAGVPIDPGKHKLDARAPGKKAWSTEVDVPVEKRALTVEVPEALEDAQARLVLDVPEAVRKLPGLAIRKDGESGPLTGFEMTVAPGEHRFEVTAPGRASATVSAIVRAGDELRLPVPPLAAIQEPPAVPAVQTHDTGVPAYVWASGVAGLLLAGTSVVFLLDQRGAQSHIDDHCPDDKACNTADGFDPDEESARVQRSFGLFVGFGVSSVACLGLSAFGFATSPSRPASDAAKGVRVKTQAWVSPGSSGVGMTGTF